MNPDPAAAVLARALRAWPDAVAVEDGDGLAWTYRELAARVERLARELVAGDVRRVAWMADNGPTPIVVELAALRAGCTSVPLPGFFTDDMLAHALELARPERVVTDGDAHAERIASLADPRPAPAAAPREAATLTFTSGTTGRPKGLLVPASLRLAVARSLARATAARPTDRHLCLLPLSVMLEVVGGVFRTLLSGGTVVAPRLSEVGLRGSRELDPHRLAHAVARHRPDVAITVPATLEALVDRLERGATSVDGLRFLGVGGAPVPRSLVERARARGLPAFEGYGLTEAGSVVSLNVPGADRPGSSGRPLPHARIRIADDGEILLALPAGVRVAGPVSPPVSGAGASPATGPGMPPGRDTHEPAWFATGDVGRLDDRGFLHVHGRKGARLVTPFGRNVSPEWVERVLCDEPELAAARVSLVDGVLHADLRLRAGVDPHGPHGSRHPHDPTALAAAAVRRANARLPDYARVEHFELLATPPTPPRVSTGEHRSSFPARRLRPDGSPIAPARPGALPAPDPSREDPS